MAEQTQIKFNRPWVMLAMEFASATTMHGVRFLAEPTKFLTRRFEPLSQLQ